MIILKNPNEKKFEFWTKTMDYPLGKCPFFRLFKTLVFWSRIYFFLSRISKKDLIEHNDFKSTSDKNVEFWAKTMD